MRNVAFRRVVTALVTIGATAALGLGLSSEAWGKSTEWGAQTGHTAGLAHVNSRSTEWG